MAKQNTTIKSFDDLPAILQAKHLAQVMGLSVPVTYELMNSKGFPVIRVGEKRLIVAKDAFILWLIEKGHNGDKGR
jgi:hypothetical protein